MRCNDLSQTRATGLASSRKAETYRAKTKCRYMPVIIFIRVAVKQKTICRADAKCRAVFLSTCGTANLVIYMHHQ